MRAATATGPDLSCDACKIILLDPGSDKKDALDTRIKQTQTRVKSGHNTSAQIERLGWLFVEKARVSSDPGFYKLAEQCALCLESTNTNSPEAMILKGHVLHSLHRFKERWQTPSAQPSPKNYRVEKTRDVETDIATTP
ncbi:MAG TPA: hypothetical protein VGN61_14535, partial [Verrucomicrobiae bacterium]